MRCSPGFTMLILALVMSQLALQSTGWGWWIPHSTKNSFPHPCLFSNMTGAWPSELAMPPPGMLVADENQNLQILQMDHSYKHPQLRACADFNLGQSSLPRTPVQFAQFACCGLQPAQFVVTVLCIPPTLLTSLTPHRFCSHQVHA